MKIEQAFKKVNNFGVFQKFALPLLGLAGAFHGMQTSSSNFISGQPERWCKIERLENFSFDQQKNIAIPYDSEGEFDSCNAFDLSWENFTIADFLNWNRSAIEESTNVIACDDFVYSKDVFTETSNSKWNLVCSNAVWGEMISTFYVIGLFFGSLSSGRVSDSLGRHTSQFGFCTILMMTLYAAAFVPNPIAFLMLRCLVGFSVRGMAASTTVLAMELSGPKQRELAGVLTPGSFSIGVMVCSGCALALRDFQLLHIVMGGFATVMWLLIIGVFPESPRWLLAKGKVEKAEKTLKWIGEVNKCPLPDDFHLTHKKSLDNKKEKLAYLDLFRNSVLRKHILIIHFLWVASNFSYIALSLNLGALSGTAYLNVFLSGATELPAQIMVLFAMKCLGRKKSFLLTGTIFAVCNAIAIPLELIPGLGIGASIFTILGRAATSALVSITQVFTAELFPTPLRQRVFGTSLGLAAAVGISGPYIGGSLRNIFRPLPNIIYCSLGVAAVVLVMFLPETIGRGLPDTIEEAVAVAKGRSRTLTMDSLPSVSVSVDKPNQNGLHVNGATPGKTIDEETDDEYSLDGNIILAHF